VIDADARRKAASAFLFPGLFPVDSGMAIIEPVRPCTCKELLDELR